MIIESNEPNDPDLQSCYDANVQDLRALNDFLEYIPTSEQFEGQYQAIRHLRRCYDR